MPEATKNWGNWDTGTLKGEYARLTNKGAANTVFILSTDSVLSLDILHARVKYSGVPVQSGVTFEVISGLTDAEFDTLDEIGGANVQSTIFYPDGDLKLADGDVLKVTAPAGGVGITATISIYTRAYK